MFKIELYGITGLFLDVINSLLADYYMNYKIGTTKIADGFYQIDEEKRAAYFMDFVIKLIVEQRMHNLLPSICISAGLHSLKRWEIGSKYKKTDAFDIMHAQIALPYCDFFLTERTLCGLIKDSHLKFDISYKCKTISNTKEAFDTLKDMQSKQEEKSAYKSKSQ